MLIYFFIFELGIISIVDIKQRSEDEKMSFIQKTFEMKTEIMQRYHYSKPTGKKGNSALTTAQLFNYYNNVVSASSTTSDDDASNQHYRRWLYIEGEMIYCSYCVCFGDSKVYGSVCERDPFTSSGTNWKTPETNSRSRLSQLVCRHEEKAYHKCISKYVELLCRTSKSTNLAAAPSFTSSQYDPSLRKAVECIIKSILHLATHCTCIFPFIILKLLVLVFFLKRILFYFY